jgi:predicted nucleic acid-binding protein
MDARWPRRAADPSGVALVPVDEDLLSAAEAVLPATVGTLDALHLVTALHLAAAGRLGAMMTYDRRLADGARANGLVVIAPR